MLDKDGRLRPFSGPRSDDAPLHDRMRSTARAARLAIGWSKLELARRAGCSATTVARLERDADRIALGTAGRILDVLGARVVIDPPRVGARIEQHDAAHACCIDHLDRRLEMLGFLVQTEVEIGDGRTRGWIDLLAFHPNAALLVLDETKTELRDAGALQRQVAWYERESWRAAARFGWRPRTLVSCVTALFTSANDAAVQVNAGFYASVFPVRANELGRMLDYPEQVDRRPGRALALIDPRSTRRRWLRPTISDGRRSPPPYADYADFMRQLRAGRRGRP